MAFYCFAGDRAVIAVSGADAAPFLQALVTGDLTPAIEGGAAVFAALLTPQGKILSDFFILPSAEGFLIDCAASEAPALLRRLAMYRLRARVSLAPLPETSVVLLWGGALPREAGIFADPRLAALGGRAVLTGERAAIAARLAAAGFTASTDEAYHAHRIGLGVPQAGRDFVFGSLFPHDADMDCLNGVAFDKGCYIGQEVVSRMEHRGIARRRTVKAEGDAVLPQTGAEIMAGGRAVGTLGSVSGRSGLAVVRLDRAGEALAADMPMTAEGVRVRLSLPSFARFGWQAAEDPA